MTATALDRTAPARELSVGDRLARAATRLYDAEVALHIARQSKVDAWVAAAYDRLHDAVREHRAALAAAVTVAAIHRRPLHLERRAS